LSARRRREGEKESTSSAKGRTYLITAGERGGRVTHTKSVCHKKCPKTEGTPSTRGRET